jgi:uncharacterized protein
VTSDGSERTKFENPGIDERCALLKRVKTIAVVGLSPNPARPSYGVTRALQGFGYTIIPVHPVVRSVLGVTYPPPRRCQNPMDLVDIFRRAEHIDAVDNDVPASV